MPAGLHIVKKSRPGKPVRWYVYAWRGGPQILMKEGGSQPEITAQLTDAAAAERRKGTHVGDDTINSLIAQYKRPECAEWSKLAKSTKANYSTWLERIKTEFGNTPLKLFTDRRIRGDVLDWRDKWSGQPRSADAAIETFSALLGWAYGRGKLPANVLEGISSLYDQDRSDIIWMKKDFDAFLPAACVEVQEAVELAACTGLRRGDLVEVPWDAVGEHAIVWQTNKSRGKTLIVVPLLPETKAIMARIKVRHAAEMAAKPEKKRKPLPDTILSNSSWKPWTASGFGSRFNDAKNDSGVKVHLHDLRGTFATRCMIAGLNDREIADILGWTSKEVEKIRIKYVSQSRVVVAIGERIAAAQIA